MADAPQLTAGICARIFNANDVEEMENATKSRPTVQILSIKKVGQTSGSHAVDRHRVIISDGEHFLQAMLATPMNALVEKGELTKNSIIVVENCTCNNMGDNKLYALSRRVSLLID